MRHAFDSILTWLQSHQSILGWVGLFSLIMMVATILTVPLIIVRLPAQFLNEEKDPLTAIAQPWRWLYRVVKNLVGAALLLAGLAMLILPGQGLLTLVIALGLMDFPGKRRLSRRFIGQQRVLRAINRLRARAHQAPLAAPADPAGE
jgi:hypothetical protein